ncbi:hypothetical protein E2C01_055671 [Portunus trituberculatus]|uniref:Uncharacterized protein n=1 Tax=Portunus trituberculatus TaxID=210409 RepID=A0A5B7GWK6_PORTR|nr:hypothetical protein [Portunus trituberculatus]
MPRALSFSLELPRQDCRPEAAGAGAGSETMWAGDPARPEKHHLAVTAAYSHKGESGSHWCFHRVFPSNSLPGLLSHLPAIFIIEPERTDNHQNMPTTSELTIVSVNCRQIMPVYEATPPGSGKTTRHWGEAWHSATKKT